MRKSWKWIIVAIALLLIGLLAWFLIDYFSVPRLPFWEKEEVLNVLNEYTSTYYNDLFWYKDSGDIEEPGATRYIGTYGDCYAFLVIGSKTGATMEPYVGPVNVDGLTRDVYYPVNAYVVLYHTDPNFPTSQYRRVWYIKDEPSEYIGLYISDWQLERLTRDVEKLAKEHS